MESLRPKVGVGVIVCHQGKILLGKRKNSHGEGHWALPGGHVEFGESFEQCAARELDEETGLKALAFRTGPWTNEVIEGKHYVTFFVFVDLFEGSVQLLEPHKCEGWEWICPTNMPSPLFQPLGSLHKQFGIALPVDPFTAVKVGE